MRGMKMDSSDNNLIAFAKTDEVNREQLFLKVHLHMTDVFSFWLVGFEQNENFIV